MDRNMGKVHTIIMHLTMNPKPRLKMDLQQMEIKRTILLRMKQQCGYAVMFMIQGLEYQVELMGGQLTVSSREHPGSTFTFILPYKVSTLSDTSDDPDELSDMVDHDAATDINDDDTNSGFFQFQPRTLGTLFSSNGSGRTQKLTPNGFGISTLPGLNGYSQYSYSLPSGNITLKEMSSIEDACSEVDVTEAVSEPESSLR